MVASPHEIWLILLTQLDWYPSSNSARFGWGKWLRGLELAKATSERTPALHLTLGLLNQSPFVQDEEPARKKKTRHVPPEV